MNIIFWALIISWICSGRRSNQRLYIAIITISLFGIGALFGMIPGIIGGVLIIGSIFEIIDRSFSKNNQLAKDSQ